MAANTAGDEAMAAALQAQFNAEGAGGGGRRGRMPGGDDDGAGGGAFEVMGADDGTLPLCV